MDTKPEMSRQEYSWHKHLAGMRAADAARNQGANPAAVDAIASASAGPVIIGGIKLGRATQGAVWTLQRVAREFAEYADANGLHPSTDPTSPGTRELIELGLATLVFCDARNCWVDLDSGNLAKLILRADEMMWDMPIEDQLALQAHFTAEMERIKRLSPEEEETPGKSQLPPSGNSPKAPIHPEGTDSQSSNG